MRKHDEFSVHDTLKDAIADVVFHSPIPPKAQADELGESLSTVYRWGDVNQPECYPPLTKVVPHARCTGNPALIRFLGRRVECVLVKLSDVQPARAAKKQADPVAAHMADLLAEIGELAGHLKQTFRDGVMSEREARRNRKEAEDVVDRAVTLMKYFQAAEESLR